MDPVLETPFLRGGLDFLMHRLALGKQGNTVAATMLRSEFQEGFERGEGPGGEDVGLERGHGLDPVGSDNGRKAHGPGGLDEKGAFPGVAFHQDDAKVGGGFGGEGGDHQAGKAGAAAEIRPETGNRGMQAPELGGIGDVAGPEICFRGAPDEVDAGVSAKKEGGESFQPVLCFT